jgi:Fe-S-cluster containining protein
MEDTPITMPIQPVKLSLDDTVQFNCHKGVACFNVCCKHIDITLTPYDIYRLQKRLGMGSREFLNQHTVPFELDGQGMPGVKMRSDDSGACLFLREDGCGVYSDRPTACRYYALGLMSMRAKDSPKDEDMYFVIKEDHCLGHQEPRTITVRDYRQEQGVEEYDVNNHAWRQVVLKKRSSGPTVGRPSQRSYQLFFTASYDLDGFRLFTTSEGFNEVYALDEATRQQLASDDLALMQFAFRLLKQVLFGEFTIELRGDAEQKRLQRKREVMAAQAKAAGLLQEIEDRGYDEPVELC